MRELAGWSDDEAAIRVPARRSGSGVRRCANPVRERAWQRRGIDSEVSLGQETVSRGSCACDLDPGSSYIVTDAITAGSHVNACTIAAHRLDRAPDRLLSRRSLRHGGPDG